MTEQKLFPFDQAKDIAVNICYKLQPYCDKIHLAGSIRRLKPEVKDIEIICVPKTHNQVSKDLFGVKIVQQARSVIPDFSRTVKSLGEILSGNSGGNYMKILLPSGIKLDLFMPKAEDYYRQYAIRTGSSDYTRKVIAAGWVRKGWCGSDQGLRKKKDCVEVTVAEGKKSFKCTNPKPELPPVWQTEQEFFQWLGVAYIHPKLRNV